MSALACQFAENAWTTGLLEWQGMGGWMGWWRPVGVLQEYERENKRGGGEGREGG